jgi:hypothetical protein
MTTKNLKSTRNVNGTLADGNPGGPGRPRRAVEVEYLAELSNALSLADWHEIVQRAVTDAKAGDDKARSWISRYALGATPVTLISLAQAEQAGISVDDELAAVTERAQQDRTMRELSDLAGIPTPISLALELGAARKVR